MSTTLTADIQSRVEAFCTEIIALVRADLLQRVEADLLAVGDTPPPLLPPPRRKPAYKTAGPSLTAAEQRTLDALAVAFVQAGPRSSWDVAGVLNRAESTIRYQLGRLVEKNAAQRIEEGGRVLYKPI